MLLHLEGQVGGLHLHADIDIETFSCLSGLLVVLAIHRELRVVGVLHPTAFVFLIYSSIYTFAHKALVELIEQIELTGQIDHGACLPTLVDHEERRNACSTGYVGVVSTKGGCDVDDTCTIFSRHIVTRDDTESFL